MVHYTEENKLKLSFNSTTRMEIINCQTERRKAFLCDIYFYVVIKRERIYGFAAEFGEICFHDHDLAHSTLNVCTLDSRVKNIERKYIAGHCLGAFIETSEGLTNLGLSNLPSYNAEISGYRFQLASYLNLVVDICNLFAMDSISN